MIQVLKKQWKMQWIYGELQTVLMCLGGTFLLGFFGNLFCKAVFDLSEPLPIGMMGALVIAGSAQIMLACFGFMGEFNIAVSLGETRISFVWGYQLFGVLKMLATLFAVVLFGFIEHYVYRKAFHLPNWDFDFFQIIRVVNIGYVALAILGILAVEMMVQALLLRFGMKAFWVIWGVWMFVAFVGTRLIHPIWNSIKGLIGKRADICQNPVFWVLVILIASAAVMAVSWRMLKRQQVTV